MKLLRMDKNGTLAKTYKSKEFQDYQKLFSLYPPPGNSVTDEALEDEALDSSILSYDEEKSSIYDDKGYQTDRTAKHCFDPLDINISAILHKVYD